MLSDSDWDISDKEDEKQEEKGKVEQTAYGDAKKGNRKYSISFICVALKITGVQF